MPKTKYFEIAAFPIAGPAVYQSLVAKYIIIFIYAASSIAFGIPAITTVGGPVYGIFFPIMLTLVTGMSLSGVIRSRHTGKIRLELVGTILLIAGMVSYSVAIAWRAIESEDLHGLPAMLLPIMVSVFPYFRLKNMIRSLRPVVLVPEIPPHG